MMMTAQGFNYLDPNTWWIAKTSSERQRSPWGINIIERNGNQVILTRNQEAAGLTFLLGRLEAGKTYTVTGTYTNVDGKAYIGRITSKGEDAYVCARDFTITISNGAVSFTPQQTAEYDFLLWHNGKNPIIAESMTLIRN